jgi:Mg-chelatase subunit ChlD
MTAQPPLEPLGDASLEARIVAWVLGEATAFEAEELKRLCAERPELRVFCRRMQALHGLLTTAEAAEPDDAWKLPSDKRAKIAELFGESSPEIAIPILRSAPPTRWLLKTLLAAAACVMFGLLYRFGFEESDSAILAMNRSKQLGEDIIIVGGSSFKLDLHQPPRAAPPLDNLSRFDDGRDAAAADHRPTASADYSYKGKAAEAVAATESQTAAADAKPVSDLHGELFSGYTSQYIFRGPDLSVAEAAEDMPKKSSGRIALNENDDSFSPATLNDQPVAVPQSPIARDVSSNKDQPPADKQILASGKLAFGDGGGFGGRMNEPATNAPLGEVSSLGGEVGSVKASGAKLEAAGPPVQRGIDNAKDSSGGRSRRSTEMAGSSPITRGLRSGDSAITRSNIDAVLNNPNPAVTDSSSSQPDGGELAGSAAAELDVAAAKPLNDANVALAQQFRKVGKYEEAKALLGEVLKPGADPNNLDAKRELDWLEDPVRTNPALTYEHSGNADQIRKSLYMGEGNYNLGKYADAKRDYENVIRIDPFNTAACKGLEKLAEANSDYYRAAYDHTRAKLLMEVDKSVPQNVPKPAPIPPPVPTDETSASSEVFSTFSLHVSDASYKVAKAALDRGERPDPESIRPEEFYNAFDYGDPTPAPGEPVACKIEQTAHPILPQRSLVRIAMRTGAAGRAASQPLALTVLLDHSGSMEREDRHEGLNQAIIQLVSLLKAGDTITVAGFSRTPSLLADRLPGEQAKKLIEIVRNTPSEGGTNLEEALKLGGELALRQKNPAAQNRIVLLTDGAANLGNAKPEDLAEQIRVLRQQGISFDAAGLGAGGVNDRMLETLTRDGNGRYYLIDQPSDADENFAKQLAGAFRPAAENVKVQVHFNPARVGRYKLIGFEKHRLKTEDFRNDKVDAAELAAEEAGIALYQVELLPQGSGEIGEASVRFHAAATGQMVEQSWTIPYDEKAPAFDQATPSMQLATLAALSAEKLRGGPLAAATDFQSLAPQMAKIRSYYATSRKVGDLIEMIGKLK